MTNLQKIRAVLTGLLMLVFCVVLALYPSEGFRIIAFVICLSLLAGGVRALIYYATMARHMVGGQLQLYKGLFMLNIGLFVMRLDDIPPMSIMLYLMIGNIFAGVIDVLRAREAKQMESAGWRTSMAAGIFNFLSGIICLFCLGRPDILAYVYITDLLTTASLRIASAFRRTAIIYIP